MAKAREFLPETPEELAPDWLARALDRPVEAAEMTALGEGIGFMGDVLRMDLVPQAHTPERVVVKMPKKDNRVMGEMLGVYEREILFFRDFGQDVPVRVPALYFSEFDRDKGSENQKEILRQIDKLPLFFSKAIGVLGGAIAGAKKRRYMLIIEYLDGMEAGDQLAGLGPEPCGQVLGEIAKMHRKYHGDPALDSRFWLLPLDIDARLRHGTFLKYVDGFSRTAPSGLRDKLDWLREHGEALSRALVAESTPTLLHGDLRLDNVVFDGARCAFIDWQLARCGPAAYDVAYFLSSALRAEVGAAETRALLEGYHAALALADYPFDRFLRDYQRSLLVILGNLTSVEQVELGEGRGQAVMRAWFDRLDARLADVRPDAL